MDTGIRLNMDLPNYGTDLRAKTKLKGEVKNLKYNLISLPLYFAGNLKEIE